MRELRSLDCYRFEGIFVNKVFYELDLWVLLFCVWSTVLFVERYSITRTGSTLRFNEYSSFYYRY